MKTEEIYDGKAEQLTCGASCIFILADGGGLPRDCNWSPRDDTCRVVAEVTIEGTKAGAFFGCTVTGNPVACAIAAAGQSVAATGVAKYGVTQLCEWSVSKIGDLIVIKTTNKAGGAENLRGAYSELKKVDGIKFLEAKF